MSEQSTDVLMHYCNAVDAGNYDLLFSILEVAQTNPGLQAAISALYLRFRSNEKWSRQLLVYRNQFQQNGER